MNMESGKDSSRSLWKVSIFLGCLLAVALVVASCTSGTVTNSSGMGTVSVMLSDPATCQAPNGPFSHVYVTITDVQANVSSTASPTDSTWADLTPNLSKAPKQVDLLGLATSQCFLTSLGDPMQLQAGTYQQIRVILASNSSSLPTSGNACSSASASNCVVLGSDSSVHALLLSSEAQTGIKIPSSQISSGSLTIAAGKTEELDINFLTCESIVREGNGQYRLKPVLHAGEVSTISTSINGTVLDAATGKPVNGTVFVAVEYLDNNSPKVDRVQMYEQVNADGTFVFCPLTGGPFDVVVMGTSARGQFYQPSIVTGVSIGSTTGNIKLYLPTATPNASLAGTVTSQNASNVGTPADVALSALETVGGTIYTIPLPPTTTQSSATLGVTTAAAIPPATCPAGTPSGTTDCASYTLNVPSGAANIGIWASGGVSLTVTTNFASYSVDGKASTCTPPEVTTTPPSTLTSTTLNVTGLNLAFQSCQ